MQLQKLIEGLSEFKETDWLEKEFRDLFNKINEVETCNANDNFDQFTYNAPVVINEEIFFNEVLVTLENFRLQKFKSRLVLINNEFKNLSQIEKIYYLETMMSELKRISIYFSRDFKLKLYSKEIQFILKELTIEYSTFLNKTTRKKSFKYLNNDFVKIRLLYKVLKKNGLIGNETNLDDFELVFRNENIKRLIRWTGSTSELKYFIKIINTPKYNFEDTKDEKWQIAVNCFIKIKKRSLETIDHKNLRTYKITPTTISKLDYLIASFL